ncbi:ImmA/IrrE family metallo-endopeptidase [Lactococcus petauri]|uniref:ImmA/IrrE family metallo-endopeptidase n=1 Tax=Lactococcus petauri TaxID=1940789 RepID=UPI00254EDB14|nr:ImmA/IrrE family metallo-endopeptidase [Lactococcus petauri]
MGKYDYKKINYTVQKALVEKCNVVFPVNILQLISQFPNIHLATYREFNATIALSLGKLAEQISSEAFSSKTSTGFVIFYNDDTSLKIPRRIRFSLAHELGHILLGHFDTYEGFLPRNGFGVVDSQIEGEADVFASEFLCPTCLTNPEWSQSFIESLFDVSGSVAKYTLQNKKKNPWIKSHEAFRKYFNQLNAHSSKYYFDEKARNEDAHAGFTRFFLETNYHFCNHCRSLEINIENKLNYCPICGSENLKIIPKSRYFQFHETEEQLIKFYAYGENNEMNYKILKLDSEGRLAEPCPKCGNEAPDKNYCSVCGSEIINKCTGEYEELSGFITMKKPCFTPLRGHDRYCPECGSQSTFLKNGLLPSWDHVEMPF